MHMHNYICTSLSLTENDFRFFEVLFSILIAKIKNKLRKLKSVQMFSELEVCVCVQLLASEFLIKIPYWIENDVILVTL